MGKNNNPEPTIFDVLGIVPPKNAKVRAAAEHVLTKTVEYARQNGSCSTGTASFLIDTLSLIGITSDQLANRINRVGGVILTVTFEVPTTGQMLRNSGKTIGTLLTVPDTYEPKFDVELGRDELSAYDRFIRNGAAVIFGTDYLKDGGQLLSVVSSRPTVTPGAEKAIVNL